MPRATDPHETPIVYLPCFECVNSDLCLIRTYENSTVSSFFSSVVQRHLTVFETFRPIVNGRFL